jgi:hypothetical protein
MVCGASSAACPRRAGQSTAIRGLLVRHLRLRMDVMHAGWPFLNEMLALLYAFPWGGHTSTLA